MRGKGKACRKDPIRFISAQRFSVHPITLSINNCQFTYQLNSGTHQGVKTRMNFLVKRLGNDEKTVNGCADYLKPLIEVYCPPRNLRSASHSLLCSQKFKTVSYGCRAFSFAGLKLWNSIPGEDFGLF